VEAEYLLWQLRGSHVSAPLVTAGSPGDPVPGGINQPHTQVLFGTADYNNDFDFSGGRIRAGAALLDGAFSAEAGGFYMERKAATVNTFGNERDQVLARPFFDPNANLFRVKLLSFTDAFGDGSRSALTTQFWGAEGNIMANLPYLSSADQVFAGVRYLDLRDNMNVTDQVTTGGLGQSFFLGQPQNTGDKVISTDRFRTVNEFYGGQVGFVRIDSWETLSLRIRGSVALGNTRESLNVVGNSTYYNSVTNNITTYPGGFLAQPTNSGTFNRDHFAVVPEVGVAVGWHVTNSLVLSLGYNFLYWSDVVRAGEQVNIRIDPTRLPESPTFDPNSPARDPIPVFHHTSFWAHGLTVGATWTF
jgi:hypothetical protein